MTLDTSCALNFLGTDESSSDALIELVGAALDHRVDICVSEVAYEEVDRNPDERERQERRKRLRTFGRLTLPQARLPERDALAEQFHTALFPDAQNGSRTNDHNRRDCRQVATHHLVGRDVFVTLDERFQRRVAATAAVPVAVLTPTDVLAQLRDAEAGSALPHIPALAVRDAEGDADEAAIREVLTPLADDYPGFSDWLTKTLTDTKTSIRVGEVDGRVGAVVISKGKDERVVKLSAFYVAEWARDHGLGPHLLWSEVRTWAGWSIDKVYVTVSSRHAELIDYFRLFGFLVEGASPRRYQDDTSELVLGRHIVRRVVDDGGLEAFATEIASRVFSSPASATLEPQTWALTPPRERPSYTWRGKAADTELVETAGGTETRAWELLALETIFHPTRFVLKGRQALIVPIQPRWAEAMLGYGQQQLSLLSTTDRPGKLLLRVDNAYYCYPTALKVAVPGTPIVFLVTGGSGLVGEARILDSVAADPEDLFLRFGGMGIYGLAEIRTHVQKRGVNAGSTLALRFGHYAPYDQPVTRQQMQAALGRNLQAQTITPIGIDEFETLRRIGGLTW